MVCGFSAHAFLYFLVGFWFGAWIRCRPRLKISQDLPKSPEVSQNLPNLSISFFELKGDASCDLP
jgi:hypothetical protein